MTVLDPRLHAIRADLADARLAGSAAAPRFAVGRLAEIAVPLASVRDAPRADAMQTTQALLGERARVFDEGEGWSWVQLEADGYVGYIASASLGQTLSTPTHRIAVSSTFAYPKPALKSQPAIALPLNARVKVVEQVGAYGKLADGGFVFARHLTPLGHWEPDFIAVARWFLNVPYLWGGKSAAGLDCSGLVQLALEAAGHACPRDSDLQELLGEAMPVAALKHGDLVFWDGHVGIATGDRLLLHANGHHMQVVLEPLDKALARIGLPTRVRRVGHPAEFGSRSSWLNTI